MSPGSGAGLAVGPSGAVVVAVHSGRAGPRGIRYVRRDPGAGFTPPRLLTGARAGTGSLDALAVASDGTFAALYHPAPADHPAPLQAWLGRGGAFLRAGAVPHSRNVADGDDYSADRTIAEPTANGDIVVVDQNGRHVGAAVLESGARRFTALPLRGPGLVATDGVHLATDPRGAAYLAADTGGSHCLIVERRASGGRAFATSYRAPGCNARSDPVPQATAIQTADGDRQVLLSIDYSYNPGVPSRLRVLTGHDGRFSAPTLLTAGLEGGDDPQVDGMVTDSDGTTTIAWPSCPTPAAPRGSARGVCRVSAVVGGARTGFPRRPSIVASQTSRTRLRAFAADRSVVLQRCPRGPGPCTISVAAARAAGGFAPGRVVTENDTTMPIVRGDRHGGLLLAWITQQGTLDAAVAETPGGPLRARRLSGPGETVSHVRALDDARAGAIVCWTQAGRTYAAVDRGD